MAHPLTPFFAPRGVALLGTSASPNKLSHGILKNLVEGPYKGGVYPVNPRYTEILGIPCYPNVASVPDPVDLAVLALPAPAIPETLEACGKRGIKAVVIISGGFKEIGPEGETIEKNLVNIARQYGMRLVGPNCVGTLDLYTGSNTTFIKGLPSVGHIGFVSQSGAVCGAVVDVFQDQGIGFSNFASLGNEADVTETDMIEFLADDPNTKVIACYVEAIRDGERFMKVAREVSKTKPIVMVKAGRTEAGAKAVSSHTGSMAGSNSAYEAAFQQSGVLMVNTAEELFNVSMALVYQPLPQGNRTVIITNSGGPAALASDSLSQNGMKLCDLSPETRAALREKLVPSAQISNPVDMLGGAEPHEYEAAVRLCLADENVDTVLAILTPQALVNPAEVARAIGRGSEGSKKPVVACFMGGVSIGEASKLFHEIKIPMYVFPEEAGAVMGAMMRYAETRKFGQEAFVEPANISKAAAEKALHQHAALKTLGEAHTRSVLAAYGLPLVAGDVAHTPEEAVKIAEKVGLPVVLKIVSPDILHKSDLGAIKLNLATSQAVMDGYNELMAQIKASQPNARIEGILVETMAPKGHEVIVGMRRVPGFGPLVMFGMGGIFVELFGDVAFGLYPMSRENALRMVLKTKAGKLLSGLRGQKPADIDAVVDCILRIGQIAHDFPEIDEIEINPLFVYEKGKGVLALDARAILK
ncbi:MAG TPA: acetate--CoA ligase family protein [Anaerolineaceae bacterium]|nr:acetate--CoA ligase family protein [Anaerolineaceae bacterium]HPN53585.1 acetate--CoA ligase family protein [Anaerolineaceae bacterium]